MIVINIGLSIVFGSVGGGLVLLFFQEHIKKKIELKYNKKLKSFESEVKERELVRQNKWEMKKNACLKALDIVDAYWSNLKWTGKDQKGIDLKDSHIEKQNPPSIEDVRKCNNELFLTCDNSSVLKEFRRLS